MAILEKAVMFTFNGEETSVTPKMQVTFMKQLPTILPNARSRCPFRVAVMLVASSGMLVPKAMMVEEPYQIKVDKGTFRVPKELFYNENDCWARIEGDTAKVGITDFLQNMTSDIFFVKFNEFGTKLEQFDEIASFESTKTVLDLISPVSGTIQKTNEKQVRTLNWQTKTPVGEGWFALIKLENFENDRQNLLLAQDYL